MATTAMGTPVGNQTFAGAYYYSALQTDLAKRYWRSASPLSAELMSEDTPEPLPPLPQHAFSERVGSNVCPDDGAKIGQRVGFYGYFVRDLRAALNYTRTRRHEPAFTAAFHNTYTTYCVSMLAAATGYRAVKNPLQDILALDSRTGWLVISDKDFADHRNARLVWVPPLISRQLEAYATYRSVIIRLLGLNDEAPGFFFFLNEKRLSRPVAPHSLAAAIDWTYKLPLNANRHLLRTRLTEKGLPGEVVDAHMGHWDLGEEPYGPYSALSPHDFKDEVAPVLNELIDTQGWRVEYAIDPQSAPPIATLNDNHGAGSTKNIPRAKSSIKTARDRDLTRLDEILDRLQPCLLEESESLQLGDKEIDAVFDEIRDDTSLQDWRYIHNTLVRRLERNTNELGWNVKVPAPVVVLNRPPAPFTPDDFRRLANLRELESKFSVSLRDLAPRSPDIDTFVAAYVEPSKRLKRGTDLATLLVGQILFSAARYGGLVSRKAIEALTSQLHSGGMKIRNHLAFDLQPRSYVTRWYADPLTATLILRYCWLVDANEVQPNSHPADHGLRAFIRGLAGGTHDLDSISAFLEAASTAWRLNQPAFVYRWSRESATSASWDEYTEMRVRFGRRLKRDVNDKQATPTESHNEPELEAGPQTGVTSQRTNNCDLNRAYHDFYACLHVKRGKSWRGQISSQVADWITQNRDRAGLVPVLMAHWVIAIALQKSATHTAIGAASSLRTYVSRIGRDIFIASKTFPDHDCADTQPWQALYKAVVDAKRGDSARRAAAVECQGFHDFVIRTIDVPPLDVGETSGVGLVSTGVSVNANYITPDEAEQAAGWLAQASDKDHRYEIANQALVLAYWSGLRIGELAGLRLKDVQIVWGTEGAPKRVELLARTHHQRSLKSDTSRRRVPISCLMPKPQLHGFIEFVRRREQHCEYLSPTRSAFLFATSGLEDHMPDQDEIRNLVTHVLREVTGDDSIVFHHLRHSAANNWLLALLAQSDTDPLWNLFPQPPEPLLDVANRINRGLMINPNRRRGILYAVATLLGHSDPSVTLQSYIHVLPWICAAATQSTNESEIYLDLARDAGVDASLLNKTASATRSWRSRRANDDASFQALTDYWLHKLRSRMTPAAYKNTVPAEPAGAVKIEPPARALPSPYMLYRIALYAEQHGLADAPSPSSAPLARLAARVGEPLWLVSGLLANMRQWGEAPAGRVVKGDRTPGKNRFQTNRKQHLRGHGRNFAITLPQNPEIPGLMPAPPHTELERQNCAAVWKQLTTLLQSTGQWDALTTGEAAVTGDPSDRELLARGLDVFLDYSNSSEHAMKFFRAGPQAAHDYIALVLKICPRNRILVEIKPPPGTTNAKAIASLRKEFGLRNVKCIVSEPTVRGYPKWPHGLPAIKLLSEPYGETAQPRASYGAWFALFSFALLYNTVSIAAKDAKNVQFFNAVDKQGI
ncbi:tyrosine-type recombinase/integrase [Salinisphaera orenii]|uniref:tyrosine-type recombinase/integrase n=1 Tax=Salinisphaera orenii TaxID=856731 RepID=UPI0013A6403C